MSLSSVVAYTDENGYRYVETSDWWKKACSVLPSFAALHWPDYSTKVIDDTINGQPRVIQLWKGRCEHFGDEMPGGVGGEVGIYERIPGRTFPTSKPDFLPSHVWDFLVTTIQEREVNDFWWPVSDQNEVEFDFINSVTNATIFHAGPEATYWMNKWMDHGSYEKYKDKQVKKHWWLPAWFPGNSQTPSFASQNTMNYKINGKSYPKW
jgi:hypothetical protein